MNHKEIDICIVSSCGGHLTEVKKLKPAYQNYRYLYVLNDKIKLNENDNNTEFVTHSERDWKFLLNLIEFYKIFKKCTPKIIISTGAGPIVPAAIIAKLFFGTRIIYIETITRISDLSLTGKLMYYLADDFFCQWPQLINRYPRATMIGPLI